MDTREEVAEVVMEEGLGYFIMNYCGADDMPDEELKKAFQKAYDALSEFEALLPEVEEC